MKHGALTLILALPALLPAASFFRVTSTAQNHWDLLDPAGRPFFSTAVCVLQPWDSSIPKGGSGYDPDGRDKAGIDAWAQRTAKRLKAWNFNTVGAWSHDAMREQGLTYTVSLALLGYNDAENRLVDLWDPAKEAAMRAEARNGAAGLRDDPLLLGYFLDNELPWYGNTGWPGPQNTPLLDKYLALDANAPGKGQAVAAVMAWYKDKLEALPRLDGRPWDSWEAFLKARPGRDALAWPAGLREHFAGLVARRYFELAVRAVRAADPKYLILGCRFAGSTPDAVVAAASACDVVSVNSYQKSGRFDQELFDRVYLLTQRPVMLTEFGFRAMENRSGNRNTKGADVTVRTQAERAAHLDRFLEGGLELPYLLGYHWFQYFDEPTPGRSFDGEDSNYGLVDVHDEPYAEITTALTRWNGEAAARHARAAHAVPASLPTPVAIQIRRHLGAEKGSGGIQPGASLGDYGRDGALNWVWKEASAEATAQAEAGALRFNFKSGNGWGCGLGLKTPGANADGSADLRAGSGLALTVTVPKGLRWQLFVSESGVGDPGQLEHPGFGGADGESWSSPVLLGTGARQTVQVAWEQLEPRTAWGEQRGNRTVDLQAVSQLDIALGGGQGEGSIEVESVTLLK